jgi:hypothetical protein
MGISLSPVLHLHQGAVSGDDNLAGGRPTARLGADSWISLTTTRLPPVVVALTSTQSITTHRRGQ